MGPHFVDGPNWLMFCWGLEVDRSWMFIGAILREKKKTDQKPRRLSSRLNQHRYRKNPMVFHLKYLKFVCRVLWGAPPAKSGFICNSTPSVRLFLTNIVGWMTNASFPVWTVQLWKLRARPMSQRYHFSAHNTKPGKGNCTICGMIFQETKMRAFNVFFGNSMSIVSFPTFVYPYIYHHLSWSISSITIQPYPARLFIQIHI